MTSRKTIESLLAGAGIRINENKPYDIRVYNKDFYDRVLSQGSLGLGESYMDGWWDCENLALFFDKIIVAAGESKIRENLQILLRLAWRSMLYMGRKAKAFEVGERHYDLGNDLYFSMLDKRLTYTCGYWENAKNLEEAQEAKLDLVCRKIGLKSGQKILDIGSGWGSFIGFAAERYGARAVGVTISREQKKLADKLYKNPRVETRLQDYRDINGQFDHVVSLGMFEHVGSRNYRRFMKIAHSSLKDNGLFLLHTIGGNHSVLTIDPWLDKYVFPNSMLPSLRQITKAIEGLFVIEDLHNFGADYDKTLMAWYNNFNAGWEDIKANYDDRFYRMWKYYLLSCAGSFRARKNQLWQIVLSKKGVPGGYRYLRPGH